MNTITRTDITSHVVEAAVGAEFTDEQIDAITDAVLDAAPLNTWTLVRTAYESSALDADGFWAIVEQVTAA